MSEDVRDSVPGIIRRDTRKENRKLFQYSKIVRCHDMVADDQVGDSNDH